MEAVSLFFLLYIVTYRFIEYFIAKEQLEYLLNPSVLKSLYVRVDFSRIFLNWVWFREPELTTFEFIFIPIFEVLSDAWLSETRSFPLTVTVQVWPYFWLSSDWMGLMCGLCLNIGCLANGQFQVLTFFESNRTICWSSGGGIFLLSTIHCRANKMLWVARWASHV